MYVPADFEVTDPAEIDALVERARLAVLVTHGPEGLYATHLPLIRDGGRLLGHIARANPHPRLSGPEEALAILQLDEAYVSPNWYPSKAIDGRQVPTWNYEAVHLYGRLEWFEDRPRLLDLLNRLTDRHEAARPAPWRVADAPADYVERLLRGIVGLSFAITRVEAKRKLGQNKPQADREGVAAGLEASSDGRDRAVAARMRSVAT